MSGDTTRLQSIKSVILMCWRLIRIKPKEDDVLFVELAGRLLANFYGCILALLFFRKPRIVLYLHDSPSLVGDPRLFYEIDRPVIRRLKGIVFPFFPLEKFIIERSIVSVTSDIATEAIQHKYGIHDVVTLPLVYDSLHYYDKDDVCFIPGPINSQDLVELLSAVVPCVRRYHLVIGHIVDGSTENDISSVLTLNTCTFELIGFVDDDQLRECYKRAKLVIRYRTSKATGNEFAASGPAIFSMQSGCMYISNDLRGSVSAVRSGAVLQFSDDLSDISHVIKHALSIRLSVADRASQYYRDNHSVEAFESTMRGLLR